ncbi:hypothetical protein [uncultured Clostridium sp.]|uniref:hypothetical protein n=1 Tax=uncultured Clostridium sp. TaxID=59620 RepID=UPI0025E0E48F|nr:hypothetical protein [uncultured Clostridium sp.]
MKETIINGIVEGLKQSVVNFFKWIGLGIINGSYWICLVACLIALILYIAGQRKAGKYVSISFVVYVVLQAIKGVLI